MRNISFTFLIINSVLFADFLEIEDGYIPKNPAYFKKRVAHIESFYRDVQKIPKQIDQLREVNRFFNAFKYQSDTSLYDTSNYWANPVQFVDNDGGDCEDYVVSKYKMLTKLGFKKNQLGISIYKVKDLTYSP